MNNDEYDTHYLQMMFETNTSSCIKKFVYTSDDYHGHNGDVEVTFTNGKVYYYKSVYSRHAMRVIMAFHDEESVGAYYNAFIKDIYSILKWDDLLEREVWVDRKSVYVKTLRDVA
jgi:hypothetical protein